ncbi:MAG: hypothetical protein IPK03_11045 [Bacteroidetes bacterium]|nr:hypothetical protein [Bacteroidota bacterium]MBP7477193.1 hypothetical protein [Chitinophagales bacterium]
METSRLFAEKVGHFKNTVKIYIKVKVNKSNDMAINTSDFVKMEKMD